MSKLQVNDIVNKDDDGSVGFSRGAVVTGVTTTTTLAVTGVATATTLKVGSAVTIGSAGLSTFQKNLLVVPSNPTLGNVDEIGVGIGTTNVAYRLTVVEANTQVNFGTASDVGGFLMSPSDGEFGISGGARFNGSNWNARHTSSSIVRHDGGGNLLFFTNSGLTKGNNFTPSERLRINDEAVTVSGIASIASVGIGTTNPATGLHLYGKALRIDDANITMQSTAPMIVLNEYGSTYGDQNWAIVRDADSFSIRWKNTSPYALRATIDSNGDADKVFLRQSKVEVNSSGAKIAGVTTCNPGTSHGETNIGLSVTGDTESLDFVNHASGDYAINNPGLDHRIVFYNGTGGIELRYENDANKMFELDSQGVKSPYITNTATGSGSNLVINSNLIKIESSTRRFKNNIRNYVGAGLSRIEQMVPRTWEDFSSGDTYSGFIAEELHDIGFESAVTYREYQGGSEIGIGDTYGSMYGNGSTPVTKDGVELDDEVLVVDNFDDRAILAEVVIALKELKAENDSLKTRIAALESS